MHRLKAPGSAGYAYDRVVGTGGIGAGMFFLLEGNQTLGRNESRAATLLPYRDFCKMHIIMHYISVLLGAGETSDFKTYPIGRIGNDEAGAALRDMMMHAGMEVSHVSTSPSRSTLFSACFHYPDHSGGNITTQTSASAELSAADISSFFEAFHADTGREIILAVPEVGIPARIQLLECGRQRGSMNVASVLSGEVQEFFRKGAFALVDVLAVNIDEAGSIAGISPEGVPTEDVVRSCIARLQRINPGITILITAGAKGCYYAGGDRLAFTPAPEVAVMSTAGAGDAFIAGYIVGLCCGLPHTKRHQDVYFSETPLESAVELGVLLAALSVTSSDTIHLDADASVLYRFSVRNNFKLGNEFLQMFNYVFRGNTT